jgi:predicted  nucleic acid-binding Zn-ribbon protein
VIEPPTQEADLTPLDSYNQLVALVGNRAQTETILHQLSVLQGEISAMAHYFNYELQFHEDTEVLAAALPQIFSSFNALIEYLLIMREDFESGDHQAATELLLNPFRRRIDRLYKAFDSLLEEERQREKLSRSPFIDTLLRSGQMCLTGDLAPLLFHDRVRELLYHHQGFMASFDSIEPESGEARFLEDNGARVSEALELINVALLELDEELTEEPEEPDFEMLEEALGTIAESTETLLDLQEGFLEQVERSRERPCVRCGTTNSGMAKACSKCGAALLTYATEGIGATSNVDLRIEEEIVTAESARPELLQSLLDAVEGAQQGTVTPDELDNEVAAMVSRFGGVCRQLDRLTTPNDNTSAEKRQILLDTKARLETALGRFGDGLQALEEFGESQNQALLTIALATLVPAGDELEDLMKDVAQVLNLESSS